MKPTHVFIQGDFLVGEVLEHERFGKVFILDHPDVTLTRRIEVHALDSKYESDSADLLGLLLNHLRIDKDEDFDSGK